MTITVETGLGVADANSYVDLTFANAYFATYPNDAWSGSDSDLEQALIIACQSLDMLYGPRYLSFKIEQGNGPLTTLMFPRYTFIDRNGNLRAQTSIPVELKRAQCELAAGILGGTMSATPTPNQKQFVLAEDTKVGALEISYTYGKMQQVESYDGYRKVDLMLWTILKPKNPPMVLSR